MFRHIEVLFHIFYYISGVKKIVLYTSLYKGSLYRGSTVIIFSNDKTFSVRSVDNFCLAPALSLQSSFAVIVLKYFESYL